MHVGPMTSRWDKGSLGGEDNGDMCEKVTWQEVLGLLR